MDIFTSLPNAIVSDEWELGLVNRSTEVGKRYEALYFISCIVDEEMSVVLNNSPSADVIKDGTMLFVTPDSLAIVNIAQLMASFMIKNVKTGQFYEIAKVGVGKNQETAAIEHYELLLNPTEAIAEDES